jgi:hypothetical protein
MSDIIALISVAVLCFITVLLVGLCEWLLK